MESRIAERERKAKGEKQKHNSPVERRSYEVPQSVAPAATSRRALV